MVKEFRYKTAYYRDDPLECTVIVWHYCMKQEIHLPLNGFYDENGTLPGKCPNCGENIAKWTEIKHFGHEIEKNNISLNDTTLIRVETDKNKIRVSIFQSMDYRQKDNNQLDRKPFYRKLCINAKTGYTYFFGGSNFENSQRRRGACIRNVSYGMGNIYSLQINVPFNTLSYMCNEINKAVSQVHTDGVPDFESYRCKLTLDNLLLYIRCPYINPALYKEIANRGRKIWRVGSGSPLHNDMLVKNNCKNPIQQIFEQSKIPKVKSLRRIAYTQPEGLPLLASISRTFRNPDIIRPLYHTYYSHYKNKDVPYPDFSAKLFKTMIKYKGEKVIAFKLAEFLKHDKNNNAYINLVDTIRAYDDLKQCSFNFSSKYNLDELHMYLTYSVAMQEDENRKIKYSNQEVALAAADKHFSLAPAKDTFELINIGFIMNICVGAYTDYAVDKVCSIYILRNASNNSPVGCVELRDNLVTQVKGHFNRLLTGLSALFIENWIIDNNLYDVSGDISYSDDCDDNDWEANIESDCELWVQESLW